MKKNVILDNGILDMISNSKKITSSEKLNFLKNIWYMTLSEQKELIWLL